MLTSTPGCFCWNCAFAAAIAPGQPFCASVITQTTTCCALDRFVLPLAVEAAAASAAARATAAMIRNFISAPCSLEIGVYHLRTARRFAQPPPECQDQLTVVLT